MKTFMTLVVAALIALAGYRNGEAQKAPGAAPAKPAEKAPAAAPAATWKKGDKCDVEWKGNWYKAVVLEVKAPDKLKVHYVGYGSGFDEVVPPSRIRARTAGALKGDSGEAE